MHCGCTQEGQSTGQVPNVLAAPTFYVLHIVREGVTFLACTKSEMPPLLGIEVKLLHEDDVLVVDVDFCCYHL